MRNLYDKRSRLQIRAPAAGRILKASRQPGSHIKKDQIVAYFEYDRQRVIQAFLSQEEILEIGLGDHALVYFPALNERIAATISAIDRTSAFVEELQARYTWRGSRDRAAIVELSIDSEDNRRIKMLLKPGLPAIVLFNRRDTIELRSRMWEWFANRWAYVSSTIAGLFSAPGHMPSWT